MTISKSILAIGLALGLSACAKSDRLPPFETASRASSGDVLATEVALPPVTVRNILVEVPRELRVNERNTYYPRGEIVWRGDPIGDRRKQVAQIVSEAFQAGTAGMEGERLVDIRVQVRLFHALSHKARYTIGGTHDIQFWMELIDAETGGRIGDPRFVDAEFDALGGKAAVAAEAQGITQRVRIIEHLAYVIELELTDPNGFESDSSIALSVLGSF